MKLIVSVNFIVTLPPVGVQNATYREREFLSLGLIVCTLLACLDKKLSYRRGTVQCAMLINSCYVSRAMGLIKASNSKGDLQGRSRALAMMPFDRPHTISY